MAKRTIPWPKEQYHGQKNNTMTKRTIQWPKEQYNGQKNNTMAKRKRTENNGPQSTTQKTMNSEVPLKTVCVCVGGGGGAC